MSKNTRNAQTAAANSEFGMRLRALRRALAAKKITQSKLAEWMRVQLRVVQAYEQGLSWPGTDKIQNLLTYLEEYYPHKKLNPNWLIYGQGSMFHATELELITQYAVAPAVLVQDGTISEATEAAAAVLGYEPQEMIGRPSLDFLTLTSRSEVAQQVPDGYERPYTATATTKAGSEIPILILGKNIDYQGQPARLIQVRPLNANEAKNFELVSLLGEDVDAKTLIVDYLKGRQAARQLAGTM